MSNKLSKTDRQFLIERLQQGEDIPQDYKYKLFPTQQKEYELVYGGKMRANDVLANEDGVFAVPLQTEKVFNGEREAWDDGWKNIIAFGDNLQFLKTIYEDKDPLIKGKIKGKVKLIYIDPPFATASDFKSKEGSKAYTDKTKGAEFVEFLRKRLIVAREILNDTGNIIVHMDNKKSHYIKILLDEVFGESNFINEIIWHKGREGGSSRSHSSKSSMPTEYQNILIYSKQRNSRKWNQILGPYKESTIHNILKDNVGWYYTRGRMGRKPAIWEIKSGAGLKTYVLKDTEKDKNEVIDLLTKPDAEYVAMGDVWGNKRVKFSFITQYPTEKPEDLLKYLIQAGTDEGDIILDFFGGSGTTCAVAEKLNRKWITCDIGKLSFYTMQKRMLNIASSKSLENPKKKYNKEAKAFTTINTGVYDLEKVFKLEHKAYCDFVMRLFEVEAKPKKINGIKIDGWRKDGFGVMIWQYWNYPDAGVDEDYLQELHSHIGKRVGERLYIIAPASFVGFFSEYHKIDNTRYYFLKVPYHLIKELHQVPFKNFRQPTSKKNVNDLEDAIGFHFIKPPEIISKIEQDQQIITITLEKFISDFSEDNTANDMQNFESLAMVLIDKNFNGKFFDMDECYFADELVANEQCKLPAIDQKDCGNQIMLIYVDVFGNDFKEVFTLEK